MIRITSEKHNFRRCGVSHPKESVDYPDDRFSEDELAVMVAEPMLQVEFVEGDCPEFAPDDRIETTEAHDTIIVLSGRLEKTEVDLAAALADLAKVKGELEDVKGERHALKTQVERAGGIIQILEKDLAEARAAGQKPPPDPEQELIAAAKVVIDEGKVTGGGKPEVKAMEEILGRNITAADRDRAFEQLTAGGE